MGENEIKLAKINEMIAKTEQKLQRFFHENKEISIGIFIKTHLMNSKLIL